MEALGPTVGARDVTARGCPDSAAGRLFPRCVGWMWRKAALTASVETVPGGPEFHLYLISPCTGNLIDSLTLQYKVTAGPAEICQHHMLVGVGPYKEFLYESSSFVNLKHGETTALQEPCSQCVPWSDFAEKLRWSTGTLPGGHE